jgi:hypothetical protein
LEAESGKMGLVPPAAKPPGMRGFYAMGGANVNPNGASKFVIADDAPSASIRNPEIV